VDSYVLVRVAVGVRTEVFPRFWDRRGDSGELEVRGEGADGFVLEDSTFRCLVIDGGVWSGVRRTGEVGSERERGPKVLLEGEGAPLKAATRQGGREGPTRGLPRMSRS